MEGESRMLNYKYCKNNKGLKLIKQMTQKKTKRKLKTKTKKRNGTQSA